MRHRSARNRRAKPRRHLYPAVGVKGRSRPNIGVTKPAGSRVQPVQIGKRRSRKAFATREVVCCPGPLWSGAIPPGF